MTNYLNGESWGITGRNIFGPEEHCYEDSDEFKAICKQVARFIVDADETKDPTYKGVTLGAISRGTGIAVDKVSLALNWLEVQHARVIPERFSFRRFNVRIIPPSEFHKYVQQPAPADRAMDKLAFPLRNSFGAVRTKKKRARI